MTTASPPLTSWGLNLTETRIEGPIWLSKNDILSIRTGIVDAESRIQELESKIHAIERQRDAELEKIASFRNILSPIRRIPAETLSEIFEHACSDSAYKSKRAVGLSSVCSAWRNSAHHTPSLWTTMIYMERVGSFDRQSERVRTWLRRSGSLPLHLDLHFWNSGSTSEQLFQSLYPFFPRVSSLRLTGRLESYLPMLLLPPGFLPLLILKSLHLSLRWPTDSAKTQSEPWNVPRGLPVFSASLLKTISIADTGGGSSSLVNLLALDHVQLISSLELYLWNDELQLMNPRTYLAPMAKLTNLVTLRIDFCGIGSNSSSHDPETTPLILPRLKSIQISRTADTDAAHIIHIIGGLLAPRLTRLSLSLEETSDTSDLVETLRAFQERSKVSLSHLKLSGIEVHETLLAILNIFTPTIRKLQILGTGFDPLLLLRALTLRKDENALLPNLKDFQFQFNCRTVEFDNYDGLRPQIVSLAVADMIESRWWIEKGNSSEDLTGCDAKLVLPTRLCHVSMDLNTLRFAEEALRRLDLCERQGLDVIVKNYRLLGVEESEEEDSEEESQLEEEG